MVSFPISSSFSTPQQRRPSDPTWSTQTPDPSLFTPPRASQTPRGGKKTGPHTAVPKSRWSPYMAPERIKIRTGPGESCPMELFIPKKFKAEQDENEANSKTLPKKPTTSFPESKRGKLLCLSDLPVRNPSPLPTVTLVSPPIQGTPRREPDRRPRDRARPTVRLLKVLKKCESDDADKDTNWVVKDSLMNGRNEERYTDRKWNTLCSTVSLLWPEVQDWIMRCAPRRTEDDTWFNFVNDTDYTSIEYFRDPLLGNKSSGLDRVGFHMTPNTYDIACKVFKVFARSGPNLESLMNDNINPFFVIYACADCNIPLPDNFSRQLFWTHLEAILRAKCWRGLGSARATMQDYKGADAEHIPHKFSRKTEEDPEGILRTLLKHSYNLSSDSESVAVDARRPVYRLHITIKDYNWVAKAKVGTVWYEAGDLYDEDDIACLAVLDSLTRFLPYCRGGILDIFTVNIRLLWGVGGAPSGPWSVVHTVCEEYGVKLRGRWEYPGQRGPNPWALINPAAINVPPRDRDVVDSVVGGFMQMQPGGNAAYQRMVKHLTM